METKKGLKLVVVNLLVFAVILLLIEGGFRLFCSETVNAGNAMWFQYKPYVMFANSEAICTKWFNKHTNKVVEANIRTNSDGFVMKNNLDYTTERFKSINEKVVLFTGGSVAWGVGASSNEKTIAYQLERLLNEAQNEIKYIVYNFGMGGYNAQQEFITIDLWGRLLDPDWIIVMDGANDAIIGSGLAQGTGNPMYYPLIKSYVDGYLTHQEKPVFFRGKLENFVLKHSVAFRKLTGMKPIKQNCVREPNQEPTRREIKIVVPFPEVKNQLKFYVLAQESILERFQDAKYILSLQPFRENIPSTFGDIYAYDGELRVKAIASLEQEMEDLFQEHKDDLCG